MRDFIAELKAIARSGQFTAFEQGVLVCLPTGEIVTVKIVQTTKSTRPTGLRFSAFSVVTEVSAGTARGFGYGEAATPILAHQKSIAEGVERALYKALKGTLYGTANTNGWAAHTNKARVIESAVDELTERDSVLVHWLNKIPMIELHPSTWPVRLTQWASTELSQSSEFNQLRVLVADQGYKPTIVTLLLNRSGHGLMSHATGRSLDYALDKALAETCRIAQFAIENPADGVCSALATTADMTDSPSPEEHILFYAYNEVLPQWLFGVQTDWKLARKDWAIKHNSFKSQFLKRLKPKFHQIAETPLVVGFVTSDLVQKLYFGRTEDAQRRGLINVHRLNEVRPEGLINLMPHCVP